MGEKFEGSIAVLGAGGIGASVAADLTSAGLDVTVIDQWPEHVEVMKADGIEVRMPESTLHTAVDAYHLAELSSLKREFDLVFLAAKSQDTTWLVHFIEPYLKEDGVLVGLQNGMNDDAIIEIIGAERFIGCVVELSGEVFTPGHVQRNTDHGSTWFAIGELDGSTTPRLLAVQQVMANVAKVDLSDNIEGAKWTKLVNSSMILGPYGMLGIQSYQAAEMPEVCDLCAQAGGEALAVGKKLGYRIEPIFGMSAEDFEEPEDVVVGKLLHAVLNDLGKGRTTARGVVLQDYLKGRRSEVAFLSGHVSRKGREVGLPTPANDAVTEVCRRIDRGELQPRVENLELARELMASPGS